MIYFINKYKITLLGIILGLIAGYIYYFYWGCENGCTIKSSAWKMSLYGALLGGLLFNIIESNKLSKNKKGKQN